MALELGPCAVEWNGTALGKTNGGVTVTISDDSVDLVSDQYGSAAEETVITGTTVEVSMALAEVDNDKLESVLQPATAVGGTNTTATGVLVGYNKTSLALSQYGGALKLSKYVGGSASALEADQLHFPSAAPIGDVELSFDANNQRVANVTFKCFPGTVNNVECLYYFGDETEMLAVPT